MGIWRRVAYQVAAIMRAEIGERPSLQRSVRHLACISSQPSLADFLLELVIGIDRRKIERAPGTRVESRLHQEWIQFAHAENGGLTGNGYQGLLYVLRSLSGQLS